MKILVVSDTHGDFAVLKDIIESNADADMLIHLGDGERDIAKARELFPMLPIVYVAGNCDYGNHEKSHITTACGIKIFCCHGHRYGVRDGIELLAETARKYDCSIALYGHTHISRIDQTNNIVVMNPGSPSCPRGGKKPSYGIIELNVNAAVDPKIIEIGS